MAEVRRRLLRRGVLMDNVLLNGRKLEALLLPIACSQGSGSSHAQQTVWPLGGPQGWPVWMARGRSGARFFSDGPRASYHWSGGRRSSHNNGGQEAEQPLYRSRTAYYDILEVSGNATQSQIKTAYYKQTFRFHPDRNAGNEAAARRFGEVSEAYHVLGSSSLRKKYDRGILSLEDVRTAKKPNGGNSYNKEASSQKQPANGSSNSTPAKPMFDFDAFYQAHYGEQLERERFWKARREEIERKKREVKGNQFNTVSELSVLLLILPAFLLLLSFRG